LETRKTPPPSSDLEPMPEELRACWDRVNASILSEIRASGLTVIEKEPSDSTELEASFPQGISPAANPEGLVGMDDPEWMHKTQEGIDAHLLAHWRAVGKLPPLDKDR
jgi:hypothetical protein